MPNLIKQIPETMRKKGIPEETINKFDFPEAGGAKDVMALVNQMDKLLTKEQRLSVMQEQGCCKTGKGPAAHSAFGQANKDKPLKERVARSLEVDSVHKYPCKLNDDGTLSVWWDLGKGNCPCGVINKLLDSLEVPLTFCGCCGGHARHNLQKSLGVKLRLIEVVSSSSNSKGAKRCEFLYEVTE